jgi:HAD superfamily hydrolase (TIGR01509 family)
MLTQADPSADSLSTVLKSSRGILFDMDGVLIDSEPVHELALIALTEKLGRRVDDKAFLFSLKGIPEKGVAGRMREMFPETVLSVDEIIELKIKLFERIFDKVVMIEGAKEFVQRSKQAGYRMGLTTSASRPTQQLVFRTFGLDEYFETSVTGEDITKGKPDPEPYQLTATRLGLDPKECIVIEDSVNGVKSGHAAGCRVIGLTTTFPRQALVEAGAHFVVDSFRDIV